MVSSVNNTSNLSIATTIVTASSSTPASEQYYPPCDKSALNMLNSSIRFASDNKLDWSDNSFISGTFAALCTHEVAHWLQAEAGLSYRQPANQENGTATPLASLFCGQKERLTEKEMKTLADALLKLEKNCLPMEEETETAVPEMENWKEGLEKLKEFRRLGKNRKYLTVDMPRLQEKTVDLAERVWMPDTLHAGASLQLLCQELSSRPPKSPDQNVGMKNAVHSLCKLAEALEKADTLLAGLAEFRMTGNALALPVGPEAILRDLQRAREETRFASLWEAVEKPKNKESWSEQEPLHKRLDDTFSALESGCRITEQAISNARPLYLREMRAEQVWLHEEAEAVMKECRGSSIPFVHRAAEALETMCHLTAQAMSVAGDSKEAVIMALRKSAGDLCILSAALQNAVTIGPLVHEGKAGGKEARALAEKALNSVMHDVKKALKKLEKHQKPLAKVQFTGLEKTAMHDALIQLKTPVGLLAGNMDTVRHEMKDPLPDDVLEFLLRALDHSRAARWLGKQDDKTADVLSALGHLTGKGVRSVQNAYAHYTHAAKRSEFNVLMRAAARGPLGMMLRVCRATEKLSFAALEASEKKPDVTRLHADRNRKIREDKPAERVAQHRQSKMDALEVAQKTAEREIETLALVHGRLNRDLDGMLSAFAAPEKHNEISRLRARCERSMDRCQQEAGKIRRAMDRLVSPAGKGASQQLSAALRDKETYEEAKRSITDGLAGIRTAMGEFELEVALITGKCFDLFSNDSRIVRFSAEVVDMCGAMLLPDNPTAEDQEESERVMRGMALEMGRLLAKPQDPEGHDFAGRVLQEVGQRREDTAVRAQTAEEVMKFVHNWEQQKMGKAAGKTVSAFVSRSGRMLARQALPELFGGAIHIARIAKALYKCASTLATYFETRKKLNDAVEVGEHMLAVHKDAVRDRMVKSLVEICLKLIVPSEIQMGVNGALTVGAIKRDGWSAVKDQAVKTLKEDLVITTVAEGIAAGGTRIIGDVVKSLKGTPADNVKLRLAELEKIKTSMEPRQKTANAGLTQGTAEATQPGKSRIKRHAVAEDDTAVGASQKAPGSINDDIGFSMTEKEYKDTQIGIETRNSASHIKFIERQIQAIIDKHPDGHGKISSPYSYVNILIPGPPNEVKRARIIDIYTGNVPWNAEVLWLGNFGTTDSTETTRPFRKELFGQKGYKSFDGFPHSYERVTNAEKRTALHTHSAAKLRSSWEQHLATMRAKTPEMAALYRNVFKVGFQNTLYESSGAQLSPLERDTVRAFIGGDNSRVITLNYNGQPVTDIIALEVPGNNPNEKKLLLMDYNGNLLRTSAGSINNGNTFKPDTETQAFITRGMTKRDKEEVAKQTTPAITIEFSGNNFDRKLVDNYLTTQNNAFYYMVEDPQNEELSRTYKKIDDIADNINVVIGMSGAPKTTPQGMIAAAIVNIGKNVIKYIITPDAAARRNILIKASIDTASGLITDYTGGKILEKVEVHNPRLIQATKASNDSGKTTEKPGEKVTAKVTELFKYIGIEETPTPQRPSFSGPHAEQASRPEDALNASPDVTRAMLTSSTLWERALNDIKKGLFEDNKDNKLSADTIRFLEMAGVDIKALLKRYGSPASITRATTDGVIDYSQVEFDSDGVNEILDKTNKAYKKWDQTLRRNEAIQELEYMESKLPKNQEVIMPYDMLISLRKAGSNIDEFLSGNSIDDDNNPSTKYTIPAENSRLDRNRLQKLKFMLKAEQLDKSDVQGAILLLKEIRDAMSEGDTIAIPEKLIKILEQAGIDVSNYIRVQGDSFPARIAAIQRGHQYPQAHHYLHDYQVRREDVEQIIAMAETLENHKKIDKDWVDLKLTLKNLNYMHLDQPTIDFLRDKGMPIEKLLWEYGTPQSKLAAKDKTTLRVDYSKIKIDSRGQAAIDRAVEREIRRLKSTDMLSDLIEIGRLRKGTNRPFYLPEHIREFLQGNPSIHSNVDFIRILRTNKISMEELRMVYWSIKAEFSLSESSSNEDLASFVGMMAETLPAGERLVLPGYLIKLLRDKDIDIDAFLSENGDHSAVGGRRTGFELNENKLNKLKEMIINNRKTEIQEMMRRTNDLATFFGNGGDMMLPSDIREFVLASPTIDDDDVYMEMTKTKPVNSNDLKWMHWVLKSEAELPEDSTREQTLSFMQELENTMGPDDSIALPPRLIDRLRSHGIDIDNYLKNNGDTEFAKQLAELRNDGNVLHPEDIGVSKAHVTKLRKMLDSQRQMSDTMNTSSR